MTNAVVDEVTKWQSRPLDPIWPIVYLDAIVLKVRDQGVVQNKHVYMALGISLEGKKEVLGLWIEPNEGAKFWLKVITELKNRGVADVFVICCDGLKGFPEAVENLYPHTQVQLCIVHVVRNSLRYVSWKERKAIALALKTIYAAPTAEAAEQTLEAFAQRWDRRFPSISKSWREHCSG